jgi:integrase
MGQYGAVLGVAFVKKRSGSKWLTIRYRDLDTGVWKDETTGFLKGDKEDERRAQKEALKRTQQEQKFSPQMTGDFSTWVISYMERHYTNENSLRRYKIAWANLVEWLNVKKIRHPRQFLYEHVDEYMIWRQSRAKPGKDSNNTARLEMKFLSFLMKEAKRRGYLESNKLELAKIPRREAKLKEEFSDDDIKLARVLFRAKPSKWMSIVFEIMIHLGCRFSESRFPKESIDFDAMTIQLHDSKRKPNSDRKEFTVPMTEQLKTYLESLKWTDGYAVPPLDRSMNENFNSVLKKQFGTTSHSCRVTFITRCHRAGLSEPQAMALVNHSTRLVHRIYSRLNVKDAAKALSKVQPPPAPII